MEALISLTAVTSARGATNGQSYKPSQTQPIVITPAAHCSVRSTPPSSNGNGAAVAAQIAALVLGIANPCDLDKAERTKKPGVITGYCDAGGVRRLRTSKCLTKAVDSANRMSAWSKSWEEYARMSASIAQITTPKTTNTQHVITT